MIKKRAQTAASRLSEHKASAEKHVSLAPLSFEDAVSNLAAVRPDSLAESRNRKGGRHAS